MSYVWSNDPPLDAQERIKHRLRAKEHDPQMIRYETEYVCDAIERYLGIRDEVTNAVLRAPQPPAEGAAEPLVRRGGVAALPGPPVAARVAGADALDGRPAGRVTTALVIAALAASSLVSLAVCVWGGVWLVRCVGGA